MIDFKSVPVPDYMRDLKRDHRGYPITFITAYDIEGKPHFTVTDERKRQHVLRNNKCAICGQMLTKRSWMVGGYLSAFHPNGAFLDPPMHYECAEYALKVCPFIASPGYSRMRSEKMVKNMDGVFDLNPQGGTKKPAIFVAVACEQWSGIVGKRELDGAEYIRHILPDRPYLEIEFWKDGMRLDEKQAWAIVELEQSAAKPATLLPGEKIN